MKKDTHTENTIKEKRMKFGLDEIWMILSKFEISRDKVLLEI
jgi:hypothetical protein